MRKIIILLLLLFPVSVFAAAHVALPFEEEGTLKSNSPYRIKVPANWNGTLLLYVRGTGRAINPVALNPLVGVAGVPPALNEQQAVQLEAMLLADGYALAATAYPDDAGIWFVKDGMTDTVALASMFNGRVGKADRTILLSRSQGTLIGLNHAEQHPGLFDASVVGCGIGAGAPRVWDRTLDFLLAWKVAFGFPESWGTPGDVRDDLNFMNDIIPTVIGNLMTPGQIGKFEFLRLVNQLPAPSFYPAPGSSPEASWLLSTMYFSTEGRAELETEAHGAVAQNLNHVYSLTAGEKAYLAALGVDADPLLAEMNNTRYTADVNARKYNEHYAEYTGRLRMPVLTLHTTVDGLVIPAHESALKETVEAAGYGDKLVQIFAQSVGHCTFTPEQWYQAVDATSKWLDTGVAPGQASFPDFDPNYTPPPWPNP